MTKVLTSFVVLVAVKLVIVAFVAVKVVVEIVGTVRDGIVRDEAVKAPPTLTAPVTDKLPCTFSLPS